MTLLIKYKNWQGDTMIEQIKKCERCGLCCNQKPLLDQEKHSEIFWVGLSAKKVCSDSEGPLSPHTNTGMLIKTIEETIGDTVTYKTNLVKCLPLNDTKKLRYPNKKEIDCCIENLDYEIKQLSPKIVFLLGEKVSHSVERHLDIEFDKWDGFNYCYKKISGVYYVPIHHPSYIYVYKRKNIESYINSIKNLVSSLL